MVPVSGGGLDAERALRDELEAERREHRRQLAQLAGIAAGEDRLSCAAA